MHASHPEAGVFKDSCNISRYKKISGVIRRSTDRGVEIACEHKIDLCRTEIHGYWTSKKKKRKEYKFLFLRYHEKATARFIIILRFHFLLQAHAAEVMNDNSFMPRIYEPSADGGALFFNPKPTRSFRCSDKKCLALFAWCVLVRFLCAHVRIFSQMSVTAIDNASTLIVINRQKKCKKKK